MKTVTSVDIRVVQLGIDRLRTFSEAQVATLAQSIAEVGLINPITVYGRRADDGGLIGNGYRLIAGANRLEACKRLGWREIPARVLDLDELHLQLVEVDENLVSTRLTPSEEHRFLARRKQIYIALNPKTKHGGDREASRQNGDLIDEPKADRFTLDTSKKTGKSERSIQRAIAIANELGDDILTAIAGTSLDCKAGLKLLMDSDAETRDALVARAMDGECVLPVKEPGKGKKPSPSSADVDQAVAEFREWIEENGLANDWPMVRTWIEAVHPGSPLVAKLAPKETKGVFDNTKFGRA